MNQPLYPAPSLNKIKNYCPPLLVRAGKLCFLISTVALTFLVSFYLAAPLNSRSSSAPTTTASVWRFRIVLLSIYIAFAVFNLLRWLRRLVSYEVRDTIRARFTWMLIATRKKMCSWYKERYRCSSYIINYPNHKYGWYNLKNPCDNYIFCTVYLFFW